MIWYVGHLPFFPVKYIHHEICITLYSTYKIQHNITHTSNVFSTFHQVITMLFKT